jgi:hypothetical protein
MAARGQRVPDVDEDRNSAPAPRAEQLSMEIEEFEKRIIAYEAAGHSKEVTSTFWMESAVRKDWFRHGQGKGYEPQAEADRVVKSSLVRIFHELSGHRWTRKFGWEGQSKTMQRPDVRMFATPLPLFEGVETVKLGKTSVVSGLHRKGVGLEGQLSEAIGNFESLKVLDLSWNRIHGRLPHEIGQLGNLQVLNLSRNNLSGELNGAALGEMDALRVLDLSDNQISGPLPNCFDRCKRLEVLNLSRNQITGPLSPSMSKLVSLRELRLNNNHLVGDLPEWLNKLQALRDVNLSHNGFEGYLHSLLECCNLVTLQVQYNGIHGFLHPAVGGLVELRVFYAQHNQLRGTLPDEICRCVKLQRLNLSYNLFRASLPTEFGQLARLESLILEGNAFVGPVPRSIARLTRLKDFSLFKTFPGTLHMKARRGFNRKEWERQYVWGPEQGLNSLVWEFVGEAACPGFCNPSRSKDDEKPFWLFEAYDAKRGRAP